MKTLTDYRAFIASKGTAAASHGFTPANQWPSLFPHQLATLQFVCEKGRAAAFLDTGLGKSRVEAAAAAEFAQQSGRPSLILTPLAVARQMQRECAAIGVDARVIREQSEAGPGVNIANYERLPKLDPSAYGGVVLDESSILKAFTGPTKRLLCDAFASTPYRLAATATPAPNDHMELGQHAEFLGVMPGPEMLSRWFISDQTTMGGYRLKGHARIDFWRWVASWARAATLPSDLGGDDSGFVLPPLTYELVKYHAHDTWSLDHTLALIILPGLKQLKATNHGYGGVDYNDLPHAWLKDASGEDQWEWIMDEMIWAFEELANDCPGEEAFHSGTPDIVWTKVNVHGEEDPEGNFSRMDNGPNHTFHIDMEGRKKYNDRIQNGLILFGKYYRSLWD